MSTDEPKRLTVDDWLEHVSKLSRLPEAARIEAHAHFSVTGFTALLCRLIDLGVLKEFDVDVIEESMSRNIEGNEIQESLMLHLHDRLSLQLRRYSHKAGTADLRDAEENPDDSPDDD